MKTKPFLKSIMAAAIALSININPLPAMMENEDTAIVGNRSGASVTLQTQEEEKRQSPVTLGCFFEAACDTLSRSMLYYLPSLPLTMAKKFIAQYPVPSEEEQDVSLKLFHLLTEGTC